MQRDPCCGNDKTVTTEGSAELMLAWADAVVVFRIRQSSSGVGTEEQQKIIAIATRTVVVIAAAFISIREVTVRVVTTRNTAAGLLRRERRL